MGDSSVSIGVLVPLSRPGWVLAGRHLLAGLQLAAADVNGKDGIGVDGAGIPFLRYLPERVSPLGSRVEADLRKSLADAPCFVALEGYDTMIVLAEILRSRGAHPGPNCSSMAAS